MPDYGTVTGFRTYHTARGRDTSEFDDVEVEAAKLVASECLDARYGGSFPGTKVGMRAQVRSWPRVGGIDRDGYAIDSSSVPSEVEDATYELTYRQLQNPGSLSVDWSPNEFKRASVDGAVSVEYALYGSVSEVQTRFQIVDEILEGILTGGGGSSPLSGAISRV